ncbi:MAG: zincin-like metallopeptidase domain-containing protein [Betaproteobacteria bacterium]
MSIERKKPFHEQVAEKLVEQLRQGTAPWQRPWEPGEPGVHLPMNPTTGKRYKGINAIQLMAQSRSDQRWMTYKQASAVGARVHEAETRKGTPIQYWKFSEEQNKTDETGQLVLDANGEPIKEEVRLERPRVFIATVFSAEQIDSLPALPKMEQDWNALERAERILSSSGATIRHGEKNRAFYRASTDSIHLPGKAQFPAADSYYATALHELGHWTGHASRLGRDLSHPFGSEGYAKEELRAEIASMILGDELGVGHDPEQHAAYVGLWIKALQDDPLEMFRAAADAEKIQDFVLALEHKQMQEQTTQKEVAMDSDEDISVAKEARKSPELAAPLGEAEKTYLDVPYKQKDAAKALGARWDRQEQSWYVPAGVDPAPFAQWGSAGPIAREDRQYLAVPFGEHQVAKAAGALWDKATKSWYAGPNANMKKLQRWLPDSTTGQGPAMSPREEFAEALRSLRCIVAAEDPIMDGKTHRIEVEGDKKGERAGFYVGHLDGHPAGYIKNNRTGIEMKWNSKGYSLDAELRVQLAAEAAAKRQARATEQARLHERVSQRVHKQMAKLTPVEQPTVYMRAKGIAPQPGVYTDRIGRKTYVPAIDTDGKQWTTQYIQDNGIKRFAKDSHKEGCFHAIGGLEAIAKAPALVIAEGYATASSLAEVLGFGTIAAFDAGNLPYVATALHEKFPDKPIIIAGDDDQHREASDGGNPGKTKATEAAHAVGGKAIFPIFAPGEQSTNPEGFTDFNDLATKSILGRDGLERQVRAVVENVLQQHRAGSIEQKPAQKRISRQRREAHALRQ